MLMILLSAITNEADKSKAERLINKHEKLMYKIAFKILRNRKDTEDCVQETNLKMIKSLDKIDESNEKATCNFFATICVNTAKNIYKKRKIHIENSFPYDELDEETEDIGSDPLDIVISKESVGRIKSSIMNLSEKYRNIIQLKETYDCNNFEISEMLEIPIGTVKIQLHRARTKLADELTKEGLK